MRDHRGVSLAFSLGIHAVVIGSIPVTARVPLRSPQRSEVHFERQEEGFPLIRLPTAAGVTNVPAYVEGNAAETGTVADVSTFGKKDAEKIISQALSDDRDTEPVDKNKDDVTALSEALSVSKEKMAEIKSTPAYMDYYKLIREKIRQSAMQKYDHGEEGDVTVVFILTNKGQVAGASVPRMNAPISDMLKGIAIESVRKASPFPPFPPTLRYQNLEFSLEIHFRRKNN